MEFSWGILGAGDIARRHMAPAMQNAEGHRIGAVMRRDRVAAEEFGSAFGVERIYTSARDLVTDPTVDAVYIATPPSSHAELTALAAQTGKHVLCEKPIAATVEEARAMIEVCRRNGVRLMICHYQRFNRRHQQIRDWIQAGAIGRVVSARMNFSSHSPPPSTVGTAAWRYSLALAGGGPSMDLGSHCLDLLMFLCGPIRKSTVLTDRLANAVDVEDTATMMMRLASGAHATVTTHWSAWVPTPEEGSSLEILGSEGTITAHPLFSKDSSGTLFLRTANGMVDGSRGPGKRIHEEVIEHFRDAVETGAPVLAPAEDALAGLEVILNHS